MRQYLITFCAMIFCCSVSFAAPAEWVRGDANCDGDITGTDVTVIWQWITAATPQPCDCEDAMDANGSSGVTVADITYLATYIFQQGPEPPPPFPDCGTETGQDCNENTGDC